MSLFVIAFSLTLALEAPLFFALLSHRSWKERIVFWLLANLYSYPPVFFLFPYLGRSAEALAEIWAPVCEIGVGCIILPRFGKRDAAAVVIANLFSWLAGKALLPLLVRSGIF